MQLIRTIFYIALVAMVMVTAATAGERGNLAKPRVPLAVHLNAPNSLVTDGGLMRVTGYLNNTSNNALRYLRVYLTQAADDNTLDISTGSSDFARVTRAVGLRLADESGFALAVSLVTPGKYSFALWVQVPDRAKSKEFRIATFFCLRMTVRQSIPGKPYEGFYRNSSGICGQYVVKSK